MQEERFDSIERLEQFLEGTAGVAPRVTGGEAERQAHVRRVLKRLGYKTLSRRDKGVVVRYLQQTSGYSRQHPKMSTPHKSFERYLVRLFI